MGQEETVERLLVERLRHMDTRAWAQVMGNHRNGIFFACLRRIGNRADAEDICSQVFERAARAIGGFRGDSSLKTWLHTIAANLCMSHRAAHAARQHVGLDQIPPEELGALQSDTPAPDRMAGSSEILSAVERALGTLDPVLREAFHLRVREEMSYEEIAQVTGVPINTVKTRIFRARERLQQLLVEHR
jgi:RNA polymerase sigma-70 factor (ECF subfamily)